MAPFNILRVCLLSITGICLLSTPCNAELVIKGLKIGMTIDEALEVVNSRIAPEFGREVEIVGDAYNPEAAAMSGGTISSSKTDGRGFKLFTKPKDDKENIRDVPVIVDVMADQSRIVTSIRFPQTTVHKLFNTQGMSGEDFAKAIIENYGVPSLAPTPIDENLTEWVHSSPDGYKIEIKSNQHGPGYIWLTAIPKQSERKFD